MQPVLREFRTIVYLPFVVLARYQYLYLSGGSHRANVHGNFTRLIPLFVKEVLRFEFDLHPDVRLFPCGKSIKGEMK